MIFSSHRYFWFVFFLLSISTSANQLDSLKVSRWIANARQQMNIDANVGKVYLDSLRTYLDQHPNLVSQQAEYYKFLAIYNYRKSNYDSALINYQIANQKYIATKDTLEQAKIKVNTSMVYNRRSEYKEAIQSASDALALFEQLGDRKGMGVALNIIGQVYFANGNFSNALDYFKQYTVNAILANDRTEIASGLSNTGSAFSELKMYDSSLYYFREALRIQLRLNNLYSIGNSMQNLATDFQRKNQLDSAISYYYKAVSYYIKVDSKSGLTEAYFNLGVASSLKGNYTDAISFQERSLALAQETGELFLQKECLLNLSKNYEAIGQRNKAFDLYKQYDLISDSILNENNKKYIAEVSARYESEKKEQQIALQEIRLAQQSASLKLNYLIIVALLLIVALLSIIFLLIRNRGKKEMELKVRGAYIDATIQSQENERKRFAQDLHDGMGQMISSLRLLVGTIKDESSLGSRLEMVDKSEKIIDEIQKEVRGIAFNLMPQTLIQHGLLAALKEMSTRINASDKLRVTIQSFDISARQSELTEISVYRVAQEWINNIMKHSDATQIEIQLVGHDSEITLTIEDNGVGFNTHVLDNATGHGWRNIMSRIKLIGGEVEVDSKLGRVGSTLIVRIPIEFSDNSPTIEEESVKIPSGTDGFA